MCAIFTCKRCLVKSMVLLGVLLMASVFAPHCKKCPYFLRDTPIVRESKAYCSRYEDHLRKFFKAIYEAVGDEPDLISDAGQVKRGVNKIEGSGLRKQCLYIFTQMSIDLTKFSLILYLLEMFTIADKDGKITKDFFTLCGKFSKVSRKNYFDRREEMTDPLDFIKSLSPDYDEKILSSDDSSDNSEGSDDEEFEKDSIDEIDDEVVDDTFEFARRLRLSSNNMSKDELREKIKQELATKENTIIEAFSNVAAKIQEKKRWLESSKMVENTKLNIKILDYVLNKLLTFADKTYSLILRRMLWMQAGLFAFIGGDECLDDEASRYAGFAEGLEREKEKIGNECFDGLDQIEHLFSEDFVSTTSVATATSIATTSVAT